MRTKLVKIGRSKGIRLSRAILKKYRIADSVELELTQEGLLIRAPKNPRAGWEEAFRKLRAQWDTDLRDKSSMPV